MFLFFCSLYVIVKLMTHQVWLILSFSAFDWSTLFSTPLTSLRFHSIFLCLLAPLLRETKTLNDNYFSEWVNTVSRFTWAASRIAYARAMLRIFWRVSSFFFFSLRSWRGTFWKYWFIEFDSKISCRTIFLNNQVFSWYWK